MTKSTSYSISIPASTKHLGEIRRLVGKNAKDFGFSDQEIADIQLAVDEACTNVIKHAYKFDDSKKVHIEIERENERFSVIIEDKGVAFNSEKYHEPNIEKRIKNRQKGGVGVYLMRKLMDLVEYKTENGTNKITMTKFRAA